MRKRFSGFGCSESSALTAFRSRSARHFGLVAAFFISFGSQPLPLSLEAGGYYDTDGNWVSDGSSPEDSGSAGSTYDPWLSPSAEIDTDNDGISDYEEVSGYSIEIESSYETPYSYEEYDSETGEYVWREGSYTSTTHESIWVTTDPTDVDSDGDGLPDGWERLFSFHPNDPADGDQDDDGDGLRNGLEYALGTDLWNDDSDEDGLADAEEILVFGTDPLDPTDPGTSPPTNTGSDGTGSESGGTGSGTDGTGTGTGGTDSGDDDTGGNGLTPDWVTWQGEHFADLLALSPDDPEAGGDGDPDKDELSNIEEFLLGTDPRNPDSDGDGLLDGWEVAGLVLHFDRSEIPTASATTPGGSGSTWTVYGPYQFQSSTTLYDADFLNEIGITETWSRTVETHDADWGITSSTQETLERTGLYNEEGSLVFSSDGWVVNENGELVSADPLPTAPPEPTWTELFDESLQMWVGTFTNGTTVSTWWWVHTEPLEDDSDYDGMPDGWEYEHWLHPAKASDAAADPDDDALPNLAEYQNVTEPWLKDTDEDSLSDGHEVYVSLTDPLDPADPGEESGGTAPAGGGGITIMSRYQAFGGGGGGILTLVNGGLQLGALQQVLGNSLQPGLEPQKQSKHPTRDDELYIEYRRVTRSYGPFYEGDPGVDTGTGAEDGYWNEVIDPVTNELVLREWISTGGGSPYTGESTEPPQAPKYQSLSNWTSGGQNRSDESEKYSSVSAVIGNLQSQSVPPKADWKPEYSRPASLGAGASFTALKFQEAGESVSRGSGELVEVRLVRKTGQGTSYLAVERDIEKTFLKVTQSRPAPYNEADEWTIDPGVEAVTLQIGKGNSKSVGDGESPVAHAVLDPEIREGLIVAEVYYPVEVVDIKDHADTSDDVTITKWKTAEDIADNNIAWIEAHSSATDAAPRMPQLELRIPGLGQGMTIEAKLEVKYERGNGARHPSRTDKNGNTDTVRIPSDNSYQQVAGDTWQLWNDYPLEDEGFFGGDATLTYRLMNGQTQVLAPQTIRFRIGGKNPAPARARQFIETLNNAGPQGSLWFAYAIAKSESKDYNGGGTRYNQFYQLPRDASDTHLQATRRTHAGRPLWGNDGGTTPGGYGMFQVTGTASEPTANIPRQQIWNWQENALAALLILESKRIEADNWMASQKNANNANGVALPSLTVHNVTFAEGTNRTMNHAVTIKLYNGGSRPNFNFTDNGNAPGFTLDPHSSGNFCYWRSLRRVQTDPNNPRWEDGPVQNVQNPNWALARFNAYNPPFNYVDRACQEVE